MRGVVKIDASQMPVMKTACAHCPFEGSHSSGLLPVAHADYTLSITNYRAQHVCHTSNDKKLCRGGRDLLLKVMRAQGLLDEATDEAFDVKRKEVLGK